MRYSAEAYNSDDSTDFGGSYSRDWGYHGAQDCPADWALGSDEAGHPIYSQATISDYLQRDPA